jgi:hypothetical protein
VDFRFKVVDDDANVVLLVNPKEQMFVEKLKTLLRLGIVSTRYKDVYDLFYLSERVDTGVLKEYLRIYIYDDNEMFENNAQDIENRLMRIFASKVFLRRLSNPANAWLDETAENVAHSLLDYIREL